MNDQGRLNFGPNKYAALNLLLARWLRHYSNQSTYCYVTLGGTELRDVANLSWIDNTLTSKVFSYEQDKNRYTLALETANEFKAKGVNVEIRKEDIFQYRRQCDLPHIYFIDLFGQCKRNSYQREFKTWFDNDVIRA